MPPARPNSRAVEGEKVEKVQKLAVAYWGGGRRGWWGGGGILKCKLRLERLRRRTSVCPVL